MRKFIILITLLTGLNLNAQNKSFKTQFQYQITEGAIQKVVHMIDVEYLKDKRVLKIGSNGVFNNYPVKGGGFEYGALKLFTQSGVFVVKFQDGEPVKVTFFSLDMKFQIMYSQHPEELSKSPLFGAK